MKRKSLTLAAALVAAGFIGLGSAPLATAMSPGMHHHEHHHHHRLIRMRHHRHHHNGYGDHYANWCMMHHHGTYIGKDGLRHRCRGMMVY